MYHTQKANKTKLYMLHSHRHTHTTDLYHLLLNNIYIYFLLKLCLYIMLWDNRKIAPLWKFLFFKIPRKISIIALDYNC